MLFSQASLELLDETAQQVQSGELSGFESFGALIVVAAFINAIDEAIPEIEPPSPIDIHWGDFLAIHEEIKSIVRRWYNKEIESSIVILEVKPLSSELECVIQAIESDLADQYQISSDELSKERQKIVEEFRNIFKTPVATSSP